MVNNYTKKISEFNKYSYKMMSEGRRVTDVADTAQEKDRIEELEYEDRLWVQQALKRIEFRRNREKSPSAYELEIALNPQYADYQEIYDLQVDCLIESLSEIEDPKVKSICFSFIDHTLDLHNKLDSRIITFLFSGDWISEGSYNLLVKAYEVIEAMGMNVVVYMAIKKLQGDRKKRRIASSYTDKYLLDLEVIYKLKK
jgi:hypothetical protein